MSSCIFKITSRLTPVTSVVFHWPRNEWSGKRFSHTWLGVWVQVYRGFQVMWLVQGSVFVLPSAIAWPAFLVTSIFRLFSSLVCCVLIFFRFWWQRIVLVQNLELLNSLNPTMRAQWIFLPHNGDDHASDRSSRDESRSSHVCSSSPHTSSEPPDWAKELLKQQQANAAELKRLQSKMASSKSQSAQKPRAADPEFRFTINKKQYHLNKEVLEKIDKALATADGEEWFACQWLGQWKEDMEGR